MSPRQALLILTFFLLSAYLVLLAILKNNCSTKLLKSHGSFVDYDVSSDSFPKTDLSLTHGKTGKDFWDTTKPTLNCTAKNRVGHKGDGGKWACGLLALANLTVTQNYPCVVYSFGVARESSFEADVLHLSKCDIFAYDPTTKKMGPEVQRINPRVHFKNMGIKGTKDADFPNCMTLKEIMDTNGHSWIDILKVDVEGAEYDTMDRIFTDFEKLPFGQLLIELHAWKGWDQQKNQIVSILTGLQNRGLRIFNVEPNELYEDQCSEYSLINIHALRLFDQGK